MGVYMLTGTIQPKPPIWPLIGLTDLATHTYNPKPPTWPLIDLSDLATHTVIVHVHGAVYTNTHET